MIYQEFQDAPTLTVAENISLGRLPTRARRSSAGARCGRRAERVLEQMDVDLDPDAPVGSLRVGERQIVEIARALSDEARVLILDEPTAALSQQEVDRLFEFLRRLRDQGVAIIYITHRLDEVHEISDRVQVLRDGSVAALGETTDFDRPALVEAMIGRSAAEVARPPAADVGARRASRRSSCATRGVERRFAGVALQRPPGRDRRALRQARLRLRRGRRGGLRPAAARRRRRCGSTAQPAPRKGRPTLDRRAASASCPPTASARRSSPCGPVAENVAAPSWPRLARVPRADLPPRRRRRPTGAGTTSSRSARATTRCSRSARSRAATSRRSCSRRWLERGTPLLVLIEPTRGVDVGARDEIYRSMRELAAEGVAMLDLDVRLRGGRPGRRPRARDGARAASSPSSRATRSRPSRLLTEAGG